MATDIAFALGALAALGRLVPPGLRLLLLTLAVADDIGSVLVLAAFYTRPSHPAALVGAAVVVVALVVVCRAAGPPAAAVLAVGVVLWALLAVGGVEPALAGVVAGVLVTDRPRRGPTAARVERWVAPASALLVLPVFALANAGITVHRGLLAPAGAITVVVAIVVARVVGKLVGITGACLVVVRAGWGRLPAGVRWRHVAGGAAIAGIGFTVPLLVAEQAFPGNGPLVVAAELGLVGGSVLAVALGAAILRWAGRSPARAGTGLP
jgi:NhaA family Na+:H+ antiporter